MTDDVMQRPTWAAGCRCPENGWRGDCPLHGREARPDLWVEPRPLTGAERIGVERALLPPRGGDPMWLLNAMARLGAMPDPGAVGPTIRDLEVAGAMVAAEIDRRLEEGDA